MTIFKDSHHFGQSLMTIFSDDAFLERTLRSRFREKSRKFHKSSPTHLHPPNSPQTSPPPQKTFRFLLLCFFTPPKNTSKTKKTTRKPTRTFPPQTRWPENEVQEPALTWPLCCPTPVFVNVLLAPHGGTERGLIVFSPLMAVKLFFLAIPKHGQPSSNIFVCPHSNP